MSDTGGINKFRRSRIGHKSFVRKIVVNFKTLLDTSIVPAFPQDELAKVSSFLDALSLKEENLSKTYRKTFWILCNAKETLNLKSMIQLVFALYVIKKTKPYENMA